MRRWATLAVALALAACSGLPSADYPPEAAGPVASLLAAHVAATAETEPVGTAHEDAADDPAIWRNRTDPSASLIVATDKKAGLYVYGLDGKRRSFAPAGLLNNVDLVDLGESGVIVVASDRNDPANAVLRVFRLETETATLSLLGQAPAGSGEAYGLCMGQIGGQVFVYSVLKSGTVHEFALSLEKGVSALPLRTMTLASQAEGCVVDPRNGTLYVGEETRGIWKFSRNDTNGTLVAQTDGTQLVADVEGLAIAPQGDDGGLLIASSQGDNAYALYRLPDMAPAGRFRIGKGRFGATQETDGIEVATGDLGPDFPGGLFVAQDGDNQPHAQNFKMVPWQAILQATGN